MSKAIQRLGCERVENALECLKHCSHAEAIHCARKDIKRVRAVLRLVDTQIKKREFRRTIKLLREAASHLAPPRDAYVKVKTLRNLMIHFKGQLAPRALRGIRGDLRKAFDEEMKRFANEKRAKAVERVLRRVAKGVEGLEIRGKGWKALSPGVKNTYTDGQRAYQTALKDPSPENFHEWRKRAKDLWYQVTLLHRMWPEQMDAMSKELEMLGEHLGDDHDLVVLSQAAQERCTEEGRARELETVNGLIEQRHRELRAAALALGARFYAEKSSPFCNRLAGYWRIWRGEKKQSSAQPAETTT